MMIVKKGLQRSKNLFVKWCVAFDAFLQFLNSLENVPFYNIAFLFFDKEIELSNSYLGLVSR